MKWVLILALLLVGCGGDDDEPTAGSDVNTMSGDVAMATDVADDGTQGPDTPDGDAIIEGDMPPDTDPTLDRVEFAGGLVLTGLSSRPIFRHKEEGEWIMRGEVSEPIGLSMYHPDVDYRGFIRVDGGDWRQINNRLNRAFGPEQPLLPGQDIELRLVFDAGGNAGCPPQSDFWSPDVQAPPDEERCVEWGINVSFDAGGPDVLRVLNTQYIDR